MIDFNQELIRLLKEKTPAVLNPVDLFMKILPMKKEAAYRRLRGEIPLDLNEAFLVAMQLDISLDEILQMKREGPVYQTSLIRMNYTNSEEAYCQTISQINQAISYMLTGEDPMMLSAFNKLPETNIFNYGHLCKFRLFKFIYQCRKQTQPVKLSDIVISPQVRTLEKEMNALIRKVNQHTLWQRNIFHVLATDVRYFHEIGLVTKNDIEWLMEDCHTMLDEIEQSLKHGINPNGKQFHVYLSDSYFDCTYLYTQSSSFRACSINVFGINYHSSVEPALCDDVKEWIESLMKYSVLISSSGAIERIEFLKQQRKAIEDMILK